MAVEIDQSGKIEQLNTSTVVALANDESCALYITASEKQLLFKRLRTSVVARNDRLAVIFAVLIFLLIRTRKKLSTNIVVDEEYTGKDGLVCETLEKLLLRQSNGKWRGVIHVAQIGKHSRAHWLAWILHGEKKKRKEALKVTASDIMRLWE